SVRDDTTGFYWKEATLNFSEADEPPSFYSAEFIGTSSGTWSYSPAGFNAALINGHTYIVKSSATDQVGNFQVTVATQSFIFDSSGPMTVVTIPASGVSKNSLTSIEGTARDYPITGGLNKVGMARVDLQILDLGNDHQIGGVGNNEDRYYDGSSTFSVTSSTMVINISGTGEVPWQYDNPDNLWEDGHTYLVRANAFDALGNRNQITASSQFVFDSSGPLTVITRPAEGVGYNATTNILTTISGTATDLPATPQVNVGVDSAKYRITIRKDADKDNVPSAGDLYWDWSSNDFDSNSEKIITMRFDGGVYFSTTAPTWDTGFKYFIESWAEDNLGNIETRRLRSFTIDTDLPESLVTIPTDNESLKTLSMISGSAEDLTSKISQVWVKIKDFGPDRTLGGGDDL
ncbi:MAG TPA: hypothetical protein PLZ76_07825, partial [Bacillota bacterium]|nr:hypothetical protein [Bacillota bacterium]